MPHEAVGWSTWVEQNLLPWLEFNRDLTRKALSHAYWQEYCVRRSVESLRGKKYHILREHRNVDKTPIINQSEAPKCENCKISAKKKKRRPLRRRSHRRLRNPPMSQSNNNDLPQRRRSDTSKLRVEMTLIHTKLIHIKVRH